MNFETAKNIVIEYLRTQITEDSAIIEASTMEKEYGWIFFYNTKKYIETENPLHSLVGNGPIVILRETGQLCLLDSNVPSKESIENFERDRISHS